MIGTPVIISAFIPRSHIRVPECYPLSEERNAVWKKPQEISIFCTYGAPSAWAYSIPPLPWGLTFEDSIFCAQCLYVDLRTSINHSPTQHELVGFCIRDGVCLLRGTKWTYLLTLIITVSPTGMFHIHIQQQQSHSGLDRPRGFQEVKVPRFREKGTGWW